MWGFIICSGPNCRQSFPLWTRLTPCKRWLVFVWAFTTLRPTAFSNCMELQQRAQHVMRVQCQTVGRRNTAWSCARVNRLDAQNAETWFRKETWYMYLVVRLEPFRSKACLHYWDTMLNVPPFVWWLCPTLRGWEVRHCLLIAVLVYLFHAEILG